MTLEAEALSKMKRTLECLFNREAGIKGEGFDFIILETISALFSPVAIKIILSELKIVEIPILAAF